MKPKSNAHKHFADTVRRLADFRGWRGRGVPARIADASAGSITRRQAAAYLGGQRIPTGPAAVDLARTLGVEVTELFPSGSNEPLRAPGRLSGARSKEKRVGDAPVAQARTGAQYGRRPLPLNVDLARYVAERAIELFVDLADRPAADLLPAVEEWEKVVRETYAPEAVEALRPLRQALEARAARERKKGRGTGT